MESVGLRRTRWLLIVGADIDISDGARGCVEARMSWLSVGAFLCLMADLPLSAALGNSDGERAHYLDASTTHLDTYASSGIRVLLTPVGKGTATIQRTAMPPRGVEKWMYRAPRARRHRRSISSA